MTSIDRFYKLVSHPVMTEKGTSDQEKRNAFHFRVPLDAGKVEIRQAVEKVFGVRVRGVNTTRVLGKARRRGWVAGQRPDWKKAMVTLHPEDTLELF